MAAFIVNSWEGALLRMKAELTAWLASYADSAATLSAYRREVERLLLWAVLQLGKPLPSLTHEDLLVYERFLADPQQAARWVLAGSKKLGRHHNRSPHFRRGCLSNISQISSAKLPSRL
jgi:hypothetical protein